MNPSVTKYKNSTERSSNYRGKTSYIKHLIKEFVHENAALLDELEEVQVQILIAKEERKFLLKKLCEYDSQVATEVQNFAKKCNGNSPSTTNDTIKIRKRTSIDSRGGSSRKRHRKNPNQGRKKVVYPIPLDSFGRPVFPIELGGLTVHSLGEITDKMEFHTEDVIYPIGFVSTRIYGSLKDPTIKCIYTCKISEMNNLPRFEIASDDVNCPIIGDTPDACHSLLLQRINDSLSLNVVSTRPRGNDFFGLNHPTVLNLLQSSPGTRKCVNYKWIRFEAPKSTSNDAFVEDNDASLNFDCLQRSIEYCKYKMAPDVLTKPEDYVDTSKLHHDYFYS